MKTKKLLIKGVTPLFTRIITTSDRYTEADSVDEHGLIDPKRVGAIKDVQTIVEVGTSVRFVKPGDKVSLTFNRYAVKKYHKNSTVADMDEHYNEVLSYQVPMIKVDNKEMLFLMREILNLSLKTMKKLRLK